MYSYAQTILQLYSQLQRDGYSVTEMCCIRNAYELATALFSGRFLHSGKVFIAHAVGTASILASLRLPAEIVAAGLLHNVYQNGDFGDGKRSFSDTRREQIQRAVGQEIERYAARFATLQWNPQTISSISNNPHSLDPLDRQVVLLRLADQLEHLLDFDALYGGRGDRFYIDNGYLIAEMAEELGFATLATELKQALEEIHSAAGSMEFPSSRSGTFGFVIPPQSHRTRFSLEFRQLLNRGLNRLRSSARLKKLVSFWTFLKVKNKV